MGPVHQQLLRGATVPVPGVVAEPVRGRLQHGERLDVRLLLHRVGAPRRGAQFTALMYSVVGTLMLNRIDVLRWLEAWLAACADTGGRPPDDTAAWLPWSMDAARRRELTAPT